MVARRYHVGSFDDDASYILAARAVAAGHGITSRLAGGVPLISVYPPGYPVLLSPLAALWPSGDLAFRALSLALFVAIFPLTWVYLGRRRVSPPVRLAVLALLALNPVLATYATMVMPEVAFVVVGLLMLLAIDRWQQEQRTITWAGAGVALSAAGILWLKEAGVGVVIGVVVWLLLRRWWRKALWAAAAPVALFLPLLVVRARLGTSLIGSRYSGDLGGVFKGGLVARILHVVPDAAWTYVTEAVPHTIMPTTRGLLPAEGPIGALLLVLAWTATPLVVVGFVVWCRRHSDAASLAVPVYLAETLIYPFTNERRVILVLPLIVAWYVLGATSVFATVPRAAGRFPSRFMPAVATGLPVLACALALICLGGQFTRDYLYFEGADSSSPGGSSYMAFLRQLGTPDDVVETDYLWTTALYTGHRTANGAYLAGCDPARITDAIRTDGAGYLLTASLNGAGPVDDACLLAVVAGRSTAVRLFRSPRDDASVFELIGPGTGHPATRDLVADATVDGGGQPVGAADEVPQADGDPAGRYPTLTAPGATTALTWSWPQPVSISQISLGAAGALDGPTTSVKVAVRSPDGIWREVAAASGAVGAESGNPFLLVGAPQPDLVTSVRVTVTTSGPATVAIHDFHALGPGP